uniref:Uncharacterized protein n=1 Tax=Rhizophora mucronata TaxID=61149 RepID=A0A2P2QV75_RHIMU
MIKKIFKIKNKSPEQYTVARNQMPMGSLSSRKTKIIMISTGERQLNKQRVTRMKKLMIFMYKQFSKIEKN